MVLPMQKDYRENNKLITIVSWSRELTSELTDEGKCQGWLDDYAEANF